MVESYTKCCAMVTFGGWGRKRPCRRKGVVLRNGKMYCTQHDPEQIEIKRIEQSKKLKQNEELRRKTHILLSMAADIDMQDLANYKLIKQENKNGKTKSS